MTARPRKATGQRRGRQTEMREPSKPNETVEHVADSPPGDSAPPPTETPDQTFTPEQVAALDEEFPNERQPGHPGGEFGPPVPFDGAAGPGASDEPTSPSGDPEDPTPRIACPECTPPGGLHPDATAFACEHGSWGPTATDE